MNSQPTAAYIGADDILHRAQKALVLWQFSQVIAHRKIQVNLDFNNRDRHYYKEFLKEMNKQGAIQQLLWESSLFIITACWAYEGGASESGTEGRKPVFTIEHIEDDEIRENIIKLRQLRNQRIGHPVIQTQGGEAVAVGPTGGKMRPIDGWVTIREAQIYLTDELYLMLKNKLEYTINYAKRIKRDEFRSHYRFPPREDVSKS